MKRILILLSSFLVSCSGPSLVPSQLLCEYQENPGAMDVQRPRLSWVNIQGRGFQHGCDQTAWQILVASTKEELSKDNGDVWDSGMVQEASAPFVTYAGPELKSASEYWWKVRVQDKSGKLSPWSEPSKWVTGYFTESEWQAKWIGAPWDVEEPRDIKDGKSIYATIGGGADLGTVQRVAPATPSPLFRKTFSIKKGLSSARLFISGLGYFEAYVNGNRVGNDLLVPNQTDYTSRQDMDLRRLPLIIDSRAHSVFYLGYDLSRMLHEGDNVLGCMLGNGFFNSAHVWSAGYGSPRLLAQLEIQYEDGTCQRIVSDESWKVTESPVRSNDAFGGEVYDACYEIPSWSTAKADDSSWQVPVIRKAPDGRLLAQMGPSDRVIETFAPVSIEKIADKTFKVTFPEEISGRVSLSDISAEKGDTINIRYVCTTGANYDYNGINKYISAGRKDESYASHFAWFVFHTAIIENWNGELTADNVCAEAVSTSVPLNSSFETSNSLVNNISKIWIRTQKNNIHGSTPSDCPHREKGPYTGDGQIASAMVMHNFDARSFYNKWIKDINNVQDRNTGFVPGGAPWEPGCAGGAAWGGAMTIMPWEFYQAYGDRKLLLEHYEAMKMQTDFMLSFLTDDGIVSMKAAGGSFIMNLGEHVPPFTGPSMEMMHSYVTWLCLDYTSKAAGVIDRSEDAARYRKYADDLRIAFREKFFIDSLSTYGPDECDLYALKMNTPKDEAERLRVIEDFRKRIAERGNHLVTGMIGTRDFFEVLASCGLNDLAWETLMKDDYPSYGEMLKNGTTTMWEQWDAKHSHDHPMLGSGLVWLYRSLAGVTFDCEMPAYRHFTVSPYIPVGENYVSYSLNTTYGPMSVRWELLDGKFQMNIQVPEGCTATLVWPFGDREVSGSGISFKGKTALQSGKYKLASKID